MFVDILCTWLAILGVIYKYLRLHSKNEITATTVTRMTIPAPAPPPIAASLVESLSADTVAICADKIGHNYIDFPLNQNLIFLHPY